MAATFHFAEDNGAQTGSPLHGTTRSGFGADTNYPVEMNWKSVDDNTANSGTAYSAAPIVVPVSGNAYSMPKFQYGHFTGTFNQISAAKWSAHTADTGALPSGVTLQGTVTSTYATPATTNFAFATNFSSIVAIGSGISVNFSTTGPEAAGPTSTLSAAGYTQYLATQLVVASTTTVPGDVATITASLTYNEN